MMIVIGYGNTLRGDDAVGYWIAQEVARWQLANITALAVHQLTPELAATLAGYEEVLFVDATHDQHMSLLPIMPQTDASASTHTCDPQGLLALADVLYGRSPRAWWLTIPTAQYALGASLSPVAQAGAEEALQILRTLE